MNSPKRVQPKRVLLVDDFEDSRTGLRKLLEIEGYEVIEAADGEQAIEAAFDSRPDIILMDLSLPVIDGVSATKRIKEDAAMGAVPIVALSAHDLDEIQRMVATAGCVDFVTKPVDFSALLLVMAKYLAQ
jgi:two-component system, cell cycle response regulator DivK